MSWNKYIKKKLIFVIFLLFTFHLYSVEQHKETLSVYYSGVTWAIVQQKAEEEVREVDLLGMDLLEVDLLEVDLLGIDLLEVDLLEPEVSIDLSIEERKNIVSFLNENFINMLTASGVFTVFDFSDYPEKDAERIGMYRYLLSPKITEFNITESETSGLFLKISINFTFEDNINNTRRNFSTSAIGWGNNRNRMIANALDKVINQFESVIVEFEELAERFRIIDIFQGSVVINAGRNRGIRKGDFFYTYDYLTGEKTGNFIVENVEENLAFARILDTKVTPEVASLLRPYNYTGLLSKASVSYFTGRFFSGNVVGARVLWTKGFYTINPILGLNRYGLADANNNKVAVISPYMGLRIVRYIRSFTISSVASFDVGYVSENKIWGTTSGWEYFGGTVKLEVSRRITDHFSIHIEGGYTGFFSPNHEYFPEITGFVFGAGVGYRF
ncbi:MAG: hypothetical protein FWD87_07490 [Spirochaetaceae bacterium]|nr:hypothetical protein [Spirochaetaceae bacterium]